MAKKKSTTDPVWRTPEYMAWASARDRCHNPHSKCFRGYGLRGITMCDEWRNDVHAFIAYIGPRPDGMSLDRIDNNKGYEPGNVRWASKKQQARNRSNSVLIEHNGDTVTAAEWSERTGLSHSGILYRSAANLPLSSIPRQPAIYVTYEGETLSLHEWSIKTGILKSTLMSRHKRNIKPPLLFMPTQPKFANRRSRRRQ